LLVLRTGDMQKLAAFYTMLGLGFEYHRHGQSPMHYSTGIGPTTLEIYPLAIGQAAADKNLRLGFAIDNFEETTENLKASGVSFLQEPSQTGFGFMAIIADPDGRKIELYKNV